MNDKKSDTYLDVIKEYRPSWDVVLVNRNDQTNIKKYNEDGWIQLTPDIALNWPRDVHGAINLLHTKNIIFRKKKEKNHSTKPEIGFVK